MTRTALPVIAVASGCVLFLIHSTAAVGGSLGAVKFTAESTRQCTSPDDMNPHVEIVPDPDVTVDKANPKTTALPYPPSRIKIAIDSVGEIHNPTQILPTGRSCTDTVTLRNIIIPVVLDSGEKDRVVISGHASLGVAFQQNGDYYFSGGFTDSTNAQLPCNEQTKDLDKDGIFAEGPTGINPTSRAIVTLASVRSGSQPMCFFKGHGTDDSGDLKFIDWTSPYYAADELQYIRFSVLQLKSLLTARAGSNNELSVVSNFELTVELQPELDVKGAPKGYTLCSYEEPFKNSTCNLHGVRTKVAYGFEDTFVFKMLGPDSFLCRNSIFGDPLVGADKACYTQNPQTESTGEP